MLDAASKKTECDEIIENSFNEYAEEVIHSANNSKGSADNAEEHHDSDDVFLLKKHFPL